MRALLTSRSRVVMALPWPVALAGASLVLGRHLELSGDLRKFMPTRLGLGRTVMPEAASAAGDRSTVVLCPWGGTCAPC